MPDTDLQPCLHPPNNFDFSKKKGHQKNFEGNLVKKHGFYWIIPPISKNSPKYADHPPNAGHGFAALSLVLSGLTQLFLVIMDAIAANSGESIFSHAAFS